jgi:hypothetical protein
MLFDMQFPCDMVDSVSLFHPARLVAHLAQAAKVKFIESIAPTHVLLFKY